MLTYTLLAYGSLQKGQRIAQVLFIKKSGSAMHCPMYRIEGNIQSGRFIGAKHLQTLVDGHLRITITVQ